MEAILTAKPDFWIDQFLKGYRALSTIREQTQTIVFDAILGTLKDFIPAYATKYTCLENGDANRHFYELEDMALDGSISDEEYRDRMMNPEKYVKESRVDDAEVARMLVEREGLKDLGISESEEDEDGEWVLTLENGQRFRVSVEEEG